jgi:hypothetical protein
MQLADPNTLVPRKRNVANTMFLVFSARSQLKDAFKILHLRALVTVFNFEKLNSVALCKFKSFEQATTV